MERLERFWNVFGQCTASGAASAVILALVQLWKPFRTEDFGFQDFLSLFGMMTLVAVLFGIVLGGINILDGQTLIGKHPRE